MSENAVLVYVTAPDAETAARLAKAMVESRLAACANILGPITSVYWWGGKVNTEGEVALILKTTQGLEPQLTQALRQAHPYDCPCVVALPISAGNPDFLAWIAAETKPASTP
ncbi:divalent-cation tolerance protein CutA [Magnetospirillum sp. 64-120]|uniref:divalent-cation tolerance protein CutA n=1 Tax=Magnetospirillum sp. 64-120 TaxID=1895778 RepID=UPI0009286DF4|nr:divalent-cation tolerance protein CutA [Magnetospirillum sp. 64-120]OJX81172.1 MAG: divalent-cation tolerance protein CutA [Magnetospirillum sp. 64-120]